MFKDFTYALALMMNLYEMHSTKRLFMASCPADWVNLQNLIEIWKLNCDKST